MGNVAVRVEGLGKEYRIGAAQGARYRTFRETLTDAMIAPFSRARNLLRGQSYGAAGLSEAIWALKDVSFGVKHGEVVGIIGRNGAGKSTLLKVLSRITEPTSGVVDIYGRVGSLLEVGTGFHPELTGRENVYLNGAILGMSRQEIDRKFDEIVDFSGVEQFIDTPVKHYSSGMGLRLGFSVAAYLEPEILMIDEVLAVGDAEFQKKCLGKMSDVASEGRTVIFVSHNMAAITNLCPRSLLLSQGKLIRDGSSEETIAAYLSSFERPEDSSTLEDSEDRRGSGAVQFAGFHLENSAGEKTDVALAGEKLTLVFTVKVSEPSSRQIYLGFSLRNNVGVLLTYLSSSYQNIHWEFQKPGYYAIRCTIPGLPVAPGRVSVRGLLVDEHREEVDVPLVPLGFIDVQMGDFYGTGSTGYKGELAYLIKGSWHLETPDLTL